MIEINLLPEENRKKHSSARMNISAMSMPSLPIISIAMWAVAAVLIVQLIIFAVGVMGGATFKSLKLEYKAMLPKKLETEKLKVQVDATNKKVSAIDELMVKRFSWEKKLNALSDSMIPGIWLTQLRYDEKLTEVPKSREAGAPAKRRGASKPAPEKILSRYLVLQGAASGMGEEGTALVGRFIKSLKDDPEFYSDFSDIELGAIKREKMDDQEIMTFEITCFFRAK